MTTGIPVDAYPLDGLGRRGPHANSDYIDRQGGPVPARRVASEIYKRVSTLEQFPHTGRIGRIADTRELMITSLPYVDVYRISDDAVEMVRILHGAQKWP